MNPKNQWWTMGAIALVVVAAIHSCSDDSAPAGGKDGVVAAALSDSDRATIEAQARKDANESPAAEESPASLAAKIQDGALDEYTPDQFPKLYKRLGKAGVKEAEKGAKAAALKTALSSACLSVQAAAVTNESTKSKMEFFVNCEIEPVADSPITVKQWRYKAAELKDAKGHWFTADTITSAKAPGESDTDKNLRKREAERNQAPADYARCEEQIKSQLDYPSAAEFHYLAGRADFVNPQNENVIQIQFEAKNGLGNMLPFTANCIFHHN
ncbi:hypothetical protein ID866_12707, partial [Astraeus odoratus]